jgi:hypothetical protein
MPRPEDSDSASQIVSAFWLEAGRYANGSSAQTNRQDQVKKGPGSSHRSQGVMIHLHLCIQMRSERPRTVSRSYLSDGLRDYPQGCRLERLFGRLILLRKGAPEEILLAKSGCSLLSLNFQAAAAPCSRARPAPSSHWQTLRRSSRLSQALSYPS